MQHNTHNSYTCASTYARHIHMLLTHVTNTCSEHTLLAAQTTYILTHICGFCYFYYFFVSAFYIRYALNTHMMFIFAVSFTILACMRLCSSFCSFFSLFSFVSYIFIHNIYKTHTSRMKRIQ